MTDKQLLKAQKALQAFKDSKKEYTCNKCNTTVKSAFFVGGEKHKDCGGEFIKVGGI
jgi:hypothetical protein